MRFEQKRRISKGQHQNMNGLLEFMKGRGLLDVSAEALKQCGLEPENFKARDPDALLALAERQIRKFPFNAVGGCWFRLYTEASIAKAALKVSSHKDYSGHLAELSEQDLCKAIETLDYALIVAGGQGHKGEIQSLFEMLESVLNSPDQGRTASDARPSKKRRVDESNPGSWLPTDAFAVPQLTKPIKRLRAPSLGLFERHMHKDREPVLVEGAIDHWPALEKWRSREYWLKQTLGGRRLVPVEIGQSYTDDDWKQEIMPFKKFLQQYIMGADRTDKVGYLAQHDLMTQIPALRKDIAIPDYCYCAKPPEEVLRSMMQDLKPVMTNEVSTGSRSQSEPANGAQSSEGKLDAKPTDAKETQEKASLPRSITSASSRDVGRVQEPLEDPELDCSSADETAIHHNIWMGGRTVSPLHHDPYHNILCQIHGTKYVRLYSQQYSSSLCARSSEEPAPHVSSTECAGENDKHTINMSNNSQVDIYAMELSPEEDWDERWPGISEVPYLECLLKPGQALYIPKGWWHYVRACSVGISVSFWW